MWILEHMFQPLTLRTYDSYKLLHLSPNIKPTWEKKKKDIRQPIEQLSTEIIVNNGTPILTDANHDIIPGTDKMYIITPRTRVLTVAKEHCMVFMIDLSSSLATIDSNSGKVMLGHTFEVIENIIQGLVRPFSLNSNDASPSIVIESTIMITVIAECSQFGSNMNVIPILAEYPTMRVLLQNVTVSVNNVSIILSNLKESIDAFKKDLGKFRKKLTIKRLKLGYELDVRDDHTQSVTENTALNFNLSKSSGSIFAKPSTRQHRKNSVSISKLSSTIIQTPQSQHRSRSKSVSYGKQQNKKADNGSYKKSNTSNHHHHKHSSTTAIGSDSSNIRGPIRQSIIKDKKDVWGVGKTGSSLAYILRAGYLALKLFPEKGQSSIFLLTDGVVKSNIQDESVIHQLTAENIICNAIQIGQYGDFFPGLNFGFVPDNEILEYITNATQEEDSMSRMPNMYHYRYTLKEVYLDYINACQLLRKKKENGNEEQTKSIENSSPLSKIHGITNLVSNTVPLFGQRTFPWDPLAVPITEDFGRLKFKEYFLPTECWHFMRARLRQGFVLQSVSFVEEARPATNKMGSNGTLRKQVSIEGLPNFQKKQNVLIIFILRWQPNITVQYSIKALWTSSLRNYLKSISVAQDKKIHIPEEHYVLDNDNLFNFMRAPKAEIIVKSTASFSHMLHNWDSFQRRRQMMAVQGSGGSTNDLANEPRFVKVGKMKRFLEKIVESDSMLKQLVQFNITEKMHINVTQAQNNSYSNFTVSAIEKLFQSGYIQKFSTHWAKLERSEMRVFNACWYDEDSFNLIIKNTPIFGTQSRSQAESNNIYLQQSHQTITYNNELDDVQFSWNQICDKLERWSTFTSEDQQAYIKLLNVDETLSVFNLQTFENNVNGSSNTKKFTTANNIPSLNNTKKYIVPKFCELRIIRETDHILYIQLSFFNSNDSQRQLLIESLKHLLTARYSINQNQTLTELEIKSRPDTADGAIIDIYHDNINANILLTKRPLSRLLMRDNSHYLPVTTVNNDAELSKVTNPNNIKPFWYIDSAMILTGEFIVRNYLRQYVWHWDAQDVIYDKQTYRYHFKPILNLAFENIVATRLEQNWILISSNKLFAQFYKEDTYSNNINTENVFSLQYFIWKDIQKKRISTELWFEPISNECALKTFDSIKSKIFESDKFILSQLTTFDIMYAFGRKSTTSLLELSKNQMEVEDEIHGTAKWMQKLSLFNLSSVLRLRTFLFAVYPCPNYKRHFHPEGSESIIVEQQQHINMLVNETPEMNNSTYKRNGATGTRSRTVSRFSPIGSPFLPRTPFILNVDKSKTCTCPRPDVLFCSEKNDISKLKPVLRDIALLHYYVEQSLYTVTDRNISFIKESTDDFWSSIVNELLKSKQDTEVDKSTMYLAQNFRELRCFIKIFEPSAFVVILMPRLDAVVKKFCKIDNTSPENEMISFEHMGLIMFECKRHDIKNAFENTSYLQRLQIQPIDPMSSKEWLESLRSTLRPNFHQGYFSSASLHNPLSDRTLRIMQDVSQIYSRGFVKSIFTCLLHGRAVDSEDFEKVLEICDESNIDIDLTGYLNVQTLLKRRLRTNEEELASTNQRFISVLGHYFEPVIISNSKWTNMYCYRPPFAKVGQKLGLSLSSGEKPSNLADVVMCAQNPLFIRLECTLRQPATTGNGFTEITFPVRDLPVLYEGILENGTIFNFEPESIGTKFSPVDSADGTSATLHLVCMTLPQTEYDPPNALFSHTPTCPAENTAPSHTPLFLDTDKSHRARLPSLSEDKQDALVETEARLTWLFIEEIMHGLLRSGPITQNVIHYIEAQLRKKNPFVDFPTTMFIPLAFVKNQKESRRLFFEELERYNAAPYRLVRVGDCFYASDNGTSNTLIKQSHSILKYQNQEECVFDGEGLNITTDYEVDENIKDNAINREQRNDEFCQGLGISIMEPETPEEEDDFVEKQEPHHLQLYWLLLIPQAHNVQIYFYSKMHESVNRSEIIRVTKTMVNEVMERTNQISLLQSLHDTRKCSKYLLSTVDEGKSLYSSGEESSEEDEFATSATGSNLVEILSTSGEESAFSPPKKFVPGQFSCNVVYTKRFTLHWRLGPNVAYNKLMNDTLAPFLVKNKNGMFVCSHQEAVVYCFLSECNITSHSSALLDSMNQSYISTHTTEDGFCLSNPDSPYSNTPLNVNENDALGTSHSRIRNSAYITNKPSPQGSINSERQQFSPNQSPYLTDIMVTASSPLGGKKSGGKNYEGRELVLEVYGVDLNYYIIDGLVDMIESRITSDITLKEVQQFLVRNLNSKLSRADIDFILPVEKEPLVHRLLHLPSVIENSAQFLKILRKNVSSGSSMYTLHSHYLPALIKHHHDLRYKGYVHNDIGNRISEENYTRTPIEDVSCTDLVFYYNYLNRAPGTYLPFEQKIGEGIAGICLTLLSNEGSACNKNTTSDHNDTKGLYELFTQERLLSCLDSDLEKIENGEKMNISVSIWSHSKIDVEQIYQYVYKLFRQSICDYIIENIITSVSLSKQITGDFKSITSAFLFTLKKAVEWESSTVKNITQPIKLAPWYMDSIIMKFKSSLLDVHVSMESIVGQADISFNFNDKDNTNDYLEEYNLYFPIHSSNIDEITTIDKNQQLLSFQNSKNCISGSSSKNIKATGFEGSNRDEEENIHTPVCNSRNYRYVIISGLPELVTKFSSTTADYQILNNETYDMSYLNKLGVARSFPYGSSDSVNLFRDEELQSHFNKTDALKREDTTSSHSRQESLASSMSKLLPTHTTKTKNNDAKDISHQHSFLTCILDADQLSVFTYNCTDVFTESIYNTLYKIVAQEETRHMILNNILHQKMGLFQHSQKMGSIITRKHNSQENNLVSEQNASTLYHAALAQVQMINNNSTRSPMSSSFANTFGRLIQMDLSSSVQSNDNVSGEQKPVNKTAESIAFFENLQQIITNNLDSKSYQRQRQKSANYYLVENNEKLLNSVKPTRATDLVFSSARENDANTVLRDAYTDSTDENQYAHDKDYLLRHGGPYLELYLAKSKPLAAHDKAFKVYTKWADQYYGPGHNKTIDEMMTVDELRLILKASRLLHFCRTPLIFSGSNTPTSSYMESVMNGFEKLFSDIAVFKSKEMTAWYEILAQSFMKEYASYLESIGMHLIVYGPSNDNQDEIDAYLSDFTITENYSVKSPVVYLLQVFEGGSIMCEVRITGAFVSVTLYTLHRRYGRIQYANHSNYQRRHKVGREIFQKFMSECDRFKQRIHVNSFVFDFHLRYIQRSLDDIESPPSHLNLLSVIKNTASIYDRPAIYSRNRIIQGTYQLTIEKSLAELVSWMMNSSHKLGLKPLTIDQTHVACFMSSNSLTFTDQGNENSPFRYTLIICSTDKSVSTEWRESMGVHQQGSFDLRGTNSIQKTISKVYTADITNESSIEISFRYFILITYREMDCCMSSDHCRRAWSEVLKDRPGKHTNFMDEVLVPECFKVRDVFESAKLKLECLIEKAMHFFQREAVWNKLYEDTYLDETNGHPENLIQLAKNFNPIDLVKIDRSFSKFFQLKNINWNDALDNLKLFYKLGSRDVRILDTRHVLLFVSTSDSPAFFHFEYSSNGKCSVTINTKEYRNDPLDHATAEKEYIASLATNLSYYIWKQIQSY
ncbi:MAG: hypothetical protein EXX96DRAFT_142328 [Benjaminiella poitrasii]|nr:MAG: hypothetical protein EXX96DRAFT_142328 [Benjaminiella poitrasii]